MLFQTQKRKPKQIKIKAGVQDILNRIKAKLYPFAVSSISDDDMLEELIIKFGYAYQVLSPEDFGAVIQATEQVEQNTTLSTPFDFQEFQQEIKNQDTLLPGLD